MHALHDFLVLKGVFIVLVVLESNSEIGEQVRNNICYLICLRHLIRSREIKKKYEKPFFPSNPKITTQKPQAAPAFLLFLESSWNFVDIIKPFVNKPLKHNNSQDPQAEAKSIQGN